MIRGPYQSYSSDFKAFVVANGRKNIPSHKSIPRSTVHYWRHHSVGRASRNDTDSFDGPSESNHVAMTTQLEIQREIARSLCKTLAELARAGKFQFADLSEIWSGLRQSLGEEFAEEIKDLLPRAIRHHLTGPM